MKISFPIVDWISSLFKWPLRLQVMYINTAEDKDKYLVKIRPHTVTLWHSEFGWPRILTSSKVSIY